MRRAKVIGDKVYLRAIEPGDIGDAWLDWINDLAVTRYMVTTYPQRREDLERYVAACVPPRNVLFAVCRRTDDRHIGNVRLAEIDYVNRVAAYGFMIGDAEARGRSMGTEALVLLLRYGFHHLGLNRIWSNVAAPNEASIRSSEKAGFSREGVQRQALYGNGRFHDLVLFGMLRQEFDARHGDPEAWAARERDYLQAEAGSDEAPPA